jgi:diguanylate cyclase (GGDEF)-like protein
LESTLKKLAKNIGIFDIIAIIVIILGIVWAVEFEEFAYKLIAGCISFFAVVALINSLIQKFSYLVESGKFAIKSAEKLITTTISDEKAKHTTIDNFDEKQENDNPEIKFNTENEGFIILNRSRNAENTTAKIKKEYNADFATNEDNSFKIIPKSVAKINQEQTNNNENSDENIENIEEKAAEKLQENVEKSANSVKNDFNQLNFNLIEKNEQTEKNEQKSEIKAANIEEINENINENIKKVEEKLQENVEKAANINANIEEKAAESYNKSENNKISDLDISQNFVAENSESQNPIEEFAYLISRFLVIIRSVLDTKTVAFIWVNNENETLLFDAYLSDFKDSIIENKKIKLGNDIVSQFVKRAKTQILNQINLAAELDLIPYYKKSVGTTSFIGIPIIFENSIVGVLCADTNTVIDAKKAANDIYNNSTAGFLRNFSNLISTLFGSYSKNYSAQYAIKAFKVLNRFTELTAEKGCSFSQICAAILDLITELYDFSSAGICIYDEKNQAWLIISYKSVDDVDERFFRTPISLEASLVGMTISKCKTISLTKYSYEYVRTNDFEPSIEKGSFVSVPIKSTTDTYGALFIEAKAANSLNVDFEILDSICNQAGEIFEKIQLASLFNSYVSIEMQNGILTEKFLKNRISEEILRANETQQMISLALISLDRYSSFDNLNKKSKIFEHIIAILKKQLKNFDVIGRVNADTIGVIFVNKDANQAKLLLERVRQQIATQFIDIDTEKMVITISAGIASIQANDSFNNFTSNATIALQTAQNRSNYIQIFN